MVGSDCLAHLVTRRHWFMASTSELRPHAFDPSWRKSRIAARIWIRAVAGELNARDYRLAPYFANDAGVTERLMGQAVAALKAEKRARVRAN
jgi:hypothetical protein